MYGITYQLIVYEQHGGLNGRDLVTPGETSNNHCIFEQNRRY